MGAAFGWGALAASSLVIGAVVALLFRIGLRTIGLIMAFGSGVLISAIAFDLVQEAVDKSSGHGWVVGGFFAGCLVFFGGDWLIGRMGGSQRKDPDGSQEGGSALSGKQAELGAGQAHCPRARRAAPYFEGRRPMGPRYGHPRRSLYRDVRRSGRRQRRLERE